MLPTLWQFELFGLRVPIHAFGTLIVLAFLVGTFYVRRRAARDLGRGEALGVAPEHRRAGRFRQCEHRARDARRKLRAGDELVGCQLRTRIRRVARI